MDAEATEAEEPPEFGYLQSDEPITRRAEDRLNRLRLTEAIADQVIHSPPGQGFVIAIDGPWGSGKTSAMNMIGEVIADRSDAVILRFNPWLFSGTEQLVARFLQELSIQLGEKAGSDERLRNIAERLAAYGEVLAPLVWVPFVGPWAARLGSLATAAGKTRRKDKAAPSVLAQQQKVRAALAELDRRVVVFVDDLDRVEAEQIRDVVRLIKLVADFPNVTYLLAYDAGKVSEALGSDAKAGREYLEKIVQVTHTLPEISDVPLIVLLQTELDAAIASIEHGPFSTEDWVNIFQTGMRPFFKNVRDVRRYLNAVPVTLRVLGDEVALVDALALETLRIFAPAAYAKLPSMISVLTGEGITGWGERPAGSEEADEQAVTQFVEAAAPNEAAVREMIRRLFPRVGRHVGGTNIIHSGQDYRRKRRVADPDVLRIYLRRTVPQDATPTQLVREAYEVMGDRERLTELLESLDATQFETLLGRLEDYEHDFDPAAVEIATEVLLNQMPRLREGRRGMLDAGADIALTRVVLRLLRRVQDERERAEIVKRVLPRIQRLSGREELIDLVGHRENVGHRLIPEADAEELYQEQNKQVLESKPSALALERQLASLFYRAREDGRPDAAGRVSELLDDDAVLLALIRSAYDERQSQTVGDLAVRSIPSLHWEGLAEMVGSEERLTARIVEMSGRVDRDELDERTQKAFETAERYVSGELPERNRMDALMEPRSDDES
jgi:predicted KAP-like P-loop ATPase